MGHSSKVMVMQNEVNRLLKARQSNSARPVDTTNLIDAIETLRVLQMEAEDTIRRLVSERSSGV